MMTPEMKVYERVTPETTETSEIMAKETITPEMMTIEKPEMMAQETMTAEMKATEIITQEMMMRGMMRTDNKTMTTEKVYEGTRNKDDDTRDTKGHDA